GSASSPHKVTNRTPLQLPYPFSDATPRSGIAKVALYFIWPADTRYNLPSSPTRRSSDLGNFGYTATEGEGTYSFYTLATDKAANTQSPTRSHDFQDQIPYDTTAPVTSDDAPGGWQNHAVTVTLSPTDSGPAGGVSGGDKT